MSSSNSDSDSVFFYVLKKSKVNKKTKKNKNEKNKKKQDIPKDKKSKKENKTEKDLKILNKKHEREEEIDEEEVERAKETFIETKKFLEEEIINDIIKYLKDDDISNIKPLSYMNAYTKIYQISNDNEEYIIPLLKEYYNKVIKDFIKYSYYMIKSDNISIIDSFIIYTKKINFIIYWMSRIFSYINKNPRLCIDSITEYKKSFFNKIENKIYNEVNKLIKEDRDGNIEHRPKIKMILKIIDDLDLGNINIIKENNQIIWINEDSELTKDKTQDKTKNKIKKESYKDKWFNGYFKNETIKYAEVKAKIDIHNLSAAEYISSELKYLNEESVRQIEYINPIFYQIINNINYKYFIEENTKELIKKDTGIDFMFNNKQYEQLKNAYNLIFYYQDIIDNNKDNDNDNKDNVNNYKKENNNESKNLISLSFKNYILKRTSQILDNKEIIKDVKRFIPELINLNKEINNLIFNCFNNHHIFLNTKNKAFIIFMSKEIYGIHLSNYIDFCMKIGFKGKSDEEVNKSLDDIIQLFLYLTSLINFQIDSDKKMSYRLLKNSSLSINWEKSLISKLKQEKGVGFVVKKNKMIEDLEDNKKELLIYKETKSKGLPNGIKFNPTVISENAWEISNSYILKIKTPKFLNDCILDFEKFYLKKYEGRKLIWCLGLSKIEIKYLCFKNKNISISNFIKLLILLLLEEYNTLSIEKIAELLECKINVILDDIKGLIYNVNFNPKCEKDKGLISGTFDIQTKTFKPEDQIYFNKDFICPRQKIITLPMGLKKTPEQTKKENEENDIFIKKNQNIILQSTITRIMKSRIGKKTPHTWLINEVVKQVDFFRAQPQQIKENIEKLIEKGIITRAKDNSCYDYCA